MASASSSVALSCIAFLGPVHFGILMPTQSSPDTKPRAWVEVDLAALLRNARALLRAVAVREPLLEKEIEEAEARIGSDG